jgi:hypothetical protein
MVCSNLEIMRALKNKFKEFFDEYLLEIEFVYLENLNNISKFI